MLRELKMESRRVNDEDELIGVLDDTDFDSSELISKSAFEEQVPVQKKPKTVRKPKTKTNSSAAISDFQKTAKKNGFSVPPVFQTFHEKAGRVVEERIEKYFNKDGKMTKEEVKAKSDSTLIIMGVIGVIIIFGILFAMIMYDKNQINENKNDIKENKEGIKENKERSIYNSSMMTNKVSPFI